MDATIGQRPRPERRQWADDQPTLQDMLSDPIVRLLMQRDGVTAADVIELVANLRSVRLSAIRSSREEPVYLRLCAD